MYRCDGCGKLFHEPKEFYEYSEFWGAGGYTGYWGSPCCNETFDEIDDDDITEDNEIYEEYAPEFDEVYCNV